MNYKEAEKLAQRLSLENPDECFYVNWIEDYEYCVDTLPEINYQEFYNTGELHYDNND